MNLPSLPQTFLDVPPYLERRDTVIRVRAGGDLQAAINKAGIDTDVLLEAGAVFKGPITLPAGRPGIHIRSADYGLPDRRVTPLDKYTMPKIWAPAGAPAIQTAAGAALYRITGLELFPQEKDYTGGIVKLGTGTEARLSAFPADITLDRCYIHGDPENGGKRGVLLSGNLLTVMRCHISGFTSDWQDTQAVSGWQGSGWAIRDNHLEASGENIMIGGVDPKIKNHSPSDIDIRFNSLHKPGMWNPRSIVCDGKSYYVKNLLEIKHGKRVLIAHNSLSGCWASAQNGNAVLFSTHSNGAAPWTVIEDITFIENVINQATRAVVFSANDGKSTTGGRLLIQDNSCLNIGSLESGGEDMDLALFGLFNGGTDVTIDRNELHGRPEYAIIVSGAPFERFVFTNNRLPHGTYGIKGDGATIGNGTLQKYFPNAVFSGNVLLGGDPANYPPGNSFT